MPERCGYLLRNQCKHHPSFNEVDGIMVTVEDEDFSGFTDCDVCLSLQAFRRDVHSQTPLERELVRQVLLRPVAQNWRATLVAERENLPPAIFITFSFSL